MKKDAIIMVIKPYVLEIVSNTAKRAVSRIVARGRSDFPSQLNNCMNFSGIFKDALCTCARKMTYGMEMAAANALTRFVTIGDLFENVSSLASLTRMENLQLQKQLQALNLKIVLQEDVFKAMLDSPDFG